MLEVAKRFERGEGYGRGRGRGCGWLSRRPRIDFSKQCRIYLNTIANALTVRERKWHQEEGLCFKCHGKACRLFQFREL